MLPLIRPVRLRYNSSFSNVVRSVLIKSNNSYIKKSRSNNTTGQYHSEPLLLSSFAWSAAQLSSSAMIFLCSSTGFLALIQRGEISSEGKGMQTYKSFAKFGTSSGQLTLPRRTSALCRVASLFRTVSPSVCNCGGNETRCCSGVNCFCFRGPFSLAFTWWCFLTGGHTGLGDSSFLRLGSLPLDLRRVIF